MGYKWKFQPKHRLKRNKEKATSEYMLKHMDLMSKDEREGLRGFLVYSVRRKDLERLDRREPTKLRLKWGARSYSLNWELRCEIWHRLVIKEKLYWVPFFKAFMDISHFNEGCQQNRINELVEAYIKKFGVIP